MDDPVERVATLLHEAAETHHIVFRISDGVDEDWATWYSNWLVNMSELSELLEQDLIRSHLTSDLVELDRRYAGASAEEDWEHFYAKHLLGLAGTSPTA
jgi:hypothetical protein